MEYEFNGWEAKLLVYGLFIFSFIGLIWTITNLVGLFT